MESLINYICKNISENKNYIIGIDGGTGAGKTTLTNELSHRLKEIGLNILKLHMDDFIHKKNIRYDSSKDEWFCFYNLQWRYDYLIDEILSGVKNNQNINKHIEVYDKEIDKYTKIKLVAESPYILLLEGVFLQRKELRKFLDYTVFIDTPRDERLKRVLSRDTYIGSENQIHKKYKKRYFPAEDYYNKKYNPIKIADFVFKIY